MRRRESGFRNPYPERIAAGARSADGYRGRKPFVAHHFAHIEPESERREQIGDVVELVGQGRPRALARPIEPDERVEEHDEGTAFGDEAVDGAEHRALQHRGVDDQEHVDIRRQRVREVRHHREIAGRAQLLEHRQSCASRAYRARRDERAQHRDARRALAHQEAERGRDVVLQELRTIDVEIGHGQGTRGVAQLDPEEEGVPARHRHPANPCSEGGDLGLGVGSRVEPAHGDLSVARSREGVEHRLGPACMGADGRRDAFLLHAPEERRSDLARQRVEDRAGPGSQRVLAFFADVDESAPPLRDTGDRRHANGKRGESAGTAKHDRGPRTAARREATRPRAMASARTDMSPKYASGPAPSRPLDSASTHRRGPSDVTASTPQAGSQSSRRCATPSCRS